MRGQGTERLVVAMKPPIAVERRGGVIQQAWEMTRATGRNLDDLKPYDIPKILVWNAWFHVKAKPERREGRRSDDREVEGNPATTCTNSGIG